MKKDANPFAPEWIDAIVEGKTAIIRNTLADKDLSDETRARLLREVIRVAVGETLKRTVQMMKSLAQEEVTSKAPEPAPALTTEAVAARLGVSVSTLQSYIYRKIVPVPPKLANRFQWRDKDLERAAAAVQRYKKYGRRDRPNS